jgi:hypothetical protein
MFGLDIAHGDGGEFGLFVQKPGRQVGQQRGHFAGGLRMGRAAEQDVQDGHVFSPVNVDFYFKEITKPPKYHKMHNRSPLFAKPN